MFVWQMRVTSPYQWKKAVEKVKGYIVDYVLGGEIKVTRYAIVWAELKVCWPW
jgi:RNase P/RNase MRP subunit p30